PAPHGPAPPPSRPRPPCTAPTRRSRTAAPILPLSNRSTAPSPRRSPSSSHPFWPEEPPPMPVTADRPLAVYYEHPDWFRPLFAELARRGVPHVRLHAPDHVFDPAQAAPFALVFNRMSPSAYTRGHGDAVFYTLAFLAHLERRGVRVVNGYRAFATETSKALQLALLERLGLPYPKARVIHHPTQAPRAAEELRFPVLV